MNVLAVIHGAVVRAGVFGDVRARGHRLEECSMHADREDRHPWLSDEALLLGRLLDAAGADAAAVPAAEVARETTLRIGEWNELGRRLCGGFLGVAERTAAAA